MKIGLSPVSVVALMLLPTAALPAEDRRPSSPFPTARPEAVGLAPDAVAAVAAGVRDLIADEEAVGAEVLILKGRKVVLHEVAGWQDLDARRPVRPNTIACVRSMTKPLVGTAVQMLIDEGRLALTDKASKYLPSFDNPKSRDVTVEQLLTHTAGFPLTLMNRPLSGYSGQRAVVDQAGAIGPSLKVGAFSYSDTDTETLTAVVAQVSGRPAEEFIRERILVPLGMTDTYCVLGKDAPRDRVSSNHAGSPGLWHKYWDHEAAPFFPYFLGAAALYSTPADYARFLALWLDRGRVGDRRLLSEAAVERALRPIVPMLTPGADTPYPTGLTGLRPHYGLHWMVYDGAGRAKGALPVFGHGGSDGTLALVFPEHDLMAFYFTQSRGGMSVFRFEELLAPLVGLKAPPARERLSAAQLRPYAGTYQTEKGAKRAHVQVRGRRLQVELAGQGLVTPLWPDADGRWALGEAAPGLAFTFDREAGAVTGLTLWQGDKEVSSFRRVVPAKDWPAVAQLAATRQAEQGGDRVAALRSLEMKGQIQVGAVKLDITVLAEGRDRLVRRVTTAAGVETVVLDRGRAWKQSPGQPTEELTGLLREQVLRISPLARLADWRQTHGDVQVVGQDRVGDEDVWVVRGSGEQQPPTTWYVGRATGLVLKEDSWITVKGVGTVPFLVRWEDYRDVEGVRLPFRLTSDSAVTGHQVAKFTEARPNVTVAGDAFAAPKGGK